MTEQQNIAYKESWRDEYLKGICGFANAKGGKIFIGIDDRGEVTGVDDYKKLMEDLPNKSVNHLGLAVDVNLHKKGSGSTKQELKGIALQNWLLRKMGGNWEDIPVPSATMEDLDEESIQHFLERAIAKQRIPENSFKKSLNVLLKNLNLVTKDGQLTHAALLLFGKMPTAVTGTCTFRIGRFGKSHTDLLFQDVVETNLITMADKVMDKLNDRYLIRPISYIGLERMEPLEYPEAALREAILNAIIHKDYLSTWIFLRVYDDKLEIWNPGVLPEELTIEQLKGFHSSIPRNPHIAGVLYKAGYVESWGRGTTDIISECVASGLPEPILEEDQRGIRITFLKDIYTEEYLRKLEINERQAQAVLFIKHNGYITNRQYQSEYHVSDRTALRDLDHLVSRNILIKEGDKKGSRYTLKR